MTPLQGIALLAILVAPLSGLGLAMMNAGLGRSRSAAHTMLATLLLVSAGAGAYLICGAALQSEGGLVVATGGHVWSWVGLNGFFLHGVNWEGPPTAGLTILHGMVCAGLTALIPMGAGSDRWQLTSSVLIGAVLGGVVFPLTGHWVWNDGWLASLNEIAGLSRGFADTGGAAAVQVPAGAAALAVVWLLGPRHGKYAESGMPVAVPGHDAVLSLAGALIGLTGWLGLNLAGASLHGNLVVTRLALVAVNTIVCAAGGAMAAAVLTKSRYGRPDASLCANGWTGGLVASSAAAAFVHPFAALVIGLVAGVLVPVVIELMDVHLALDDPGGTVAVHFLCGIWGLLATGLFGSGDVIAQMAGIATLLGLIFPLIFGLVWLSERITPMRTPPEGDRQGMDLHELGAGAYPEFVTHHEDSWER